MIALDWGSSQLRAYRLGDHGAVLDQRSSGDGASVLKGGAPAFEAALRTLAGDWIDASTPVLACGMVGSAHGWREAGYATCPLDLHALHRHLLAVPFADATVHIVPGVIQRGATDVMRGEETQLMCLLHDAPRLAARAMVVMPGTHSKWVQVEDGRLQAFATRMTGELYALLRRHSVLARLMPESDPRDDAAFDRGVRVAKSAGGADLARWLFGVRAHGLANELTADASPDYLSGLLIGSEIAAALADDDAPLALVGEPALCSRYARAFAAFGRDAQAFTTPLAARGLWCVARDASLA